MLNLPVEVPIVPFFAAALPFAFACFASPPARAALMDGGPSPLWLHAFLKQRVRRLFSTARTPTAGLRITFFSGRDNTAPFTFPHALCAIPRCSQLSTLNSQLAFCHGGLRATGPIYAISAPQAGQRGGGNGAGSTSAGSRQSSNARMRCRLACAAGARQP